MRLLFLGVILFSQVSFAKDCVVLLHGLTRTSKSFLIMEYELIYDDYKVVNQSYPSTEYKIEELAEKYVPKAIKRCGDVDKIHIITHSMGGILVRYYFAHTDIPENLGHVVMLAPPNQGSEVVDSFKYMIGYGWWNGPAGSQMGTEATSIPNMLGPVDYSVGVIAGTKESYFLSLFIKGPNDGKVSVERSKVEGMADHISVYASHTFIMNSKKAREQARYFLKNGEFQH